MEVTKRYEIPYKGLKNGLHRFDFEVDGTLFEACGNTEISRAACRVHVDLERAERQLMLHTTIDGTVTVPCDRCLEDCDVPVHFEGDLLVRLSDEAEEYDGEVMWLSPSETELPLAQYIYESIVLSLPYQRVHPDGECNPEMLSRFRIVSDAEFAALEARAEEQPDEAQREAQSAEWGKLAALREELLRDAEPDHPASASTPSRSDCETEK